MKKPVILSVTALLATAGLASAVDYTVDDPGVTNDWNAAAWTPSPPSWDTDSHAFILGGAVNLTPTSNPGTTINKIEVKASSGTGTTLNISDDLRTSAGFVMSWNNTGSATVNLTDGLFRSDGWNRIGASGSGSVNTFNVSGNGIFKTSSETRLAEKTDTTGIINITGGGAVDAWGANFYMGYDAGASGTINLSDGLLKHSGSYFVIGRYGSGTINQTGGRFWLNGAKMIISDNAGASGTYTISGGSVSLDDGKYLSLQDSEALFVVDGSGATSIDLSKVYADPGSTIRFNLDAGGATLAVASNLVNLADANLEVDTLAGFNGTVGQTYDLMWTQSGGFTTSNMTFSSLSSTEFDWDIVAKDGGDVLQLTVIPEPTTFSLLAVVGGIVFWYRRNFRN